ncbi:hypothetical protein FisN_11Lh104 [Fistulifera solaris]|uniref:Uncharacterized protein n=1 Tax=Fistulifera solaris TaxID=1519565 RepID=A0A1Z5J805_FISSO|nr:hypothetical protein FisN_11Lh104 [Fistulifera solaris]|eukprot:GAX09911.1 hypothetical protein FisN_11Lh104 [Fistulifera solaris]
MEETLLRALEDVKIRSTVEKCLQEMVMDVEIAEKLEEQLAHAQELKYLKEKVVEQEWALEESKVLIQERYHLQRYVADNLVRELLALSRQMGELKLIKQKHEDFLIQYDEVVAKLIQMEEELVEAKRKNESRRNDRSEESLVEETVSRQSPTHEEQEKPKAERSKERTKEESKDTECTKVTLEATIVQLPEPSVPVARAASVEVPAPLTIETDVPPNIQQPVLVKSEDTLLSTETLAKPHSVVALEEDIQEDVPTLENLETKILMQIFAYLDALDILNTAQVNISMYSRVDTLFGLGNGSGGNDSIDNSTIATVETTATTSQATQVASGMSSKVNNLETQTGPSSPPSSSSPSHHFLRRSESSPLTTASAAEGIRGLFSSMLQPSRGGKFAPSPPRTPLRSNSDAQQPMNAALASSMASKLSDAELNAIIVMTERLRQKESLVERLMQEKSELAATLESTEGVKQFLIAKVRDMEGTLAAIGDNESKISQQIASDQEVIAFLDGRVQELEREAKIHKKNEEEMRDQMATIKQHAEQKAVVMGDMLQFEREKWTENEREWRATKKLLVKEVKNCRKQMMVLQAERDGYREQNEVLRKAVLSSQSTSGL